MTLLIVVYILIFIISALILYAIMQIKLAGIEVKDFWSFIEANQILDKLYEFSKKYKTLSPQQQVVYLMEAEKVFKAFDKIPDIVWEDEFKKYLIKLDKQKPVIICGDLNVAHTEIDLKNPKTNRKNAGFTDEERAKMSELLESGFIDTFRYFYPEQEGIYSWWSYRFKAREKNAGWRIDYFLVSEDLEKRLVDAKIHTEIFGSDHCPVELDIM